jgi:hypothetical protein
MDSETEDVEEQVVAAEFNRIDSNQDGQLRSVHVLLSKLYPDFCKTSLYPKFVQI